MLLLLLMWARCLLREERYLVYPGSVDWEGRVRDPAWKCPVAEAAMDEENG